MFETENTSQMENEAFLEGLMSGEEPEAEEDTEEETTVAETEAAENTDEAEAETEGEAAEQAQQEEKTETEMFPRTIKFLGEEKQISMDEAVTAIQKGLNYDRMLEKYKGQVADFEKDVRVQFVEKLAKEAGVSAGEYITMQENQSEYQALIDEYGELSAVPPAIMEKFNRYSQANIAKAKSESAEAEKRAFLAKKDAEYIEFMENHPDFSGEVPQEVMEMVSAGESLEGAYARYRVKELESELSKVKKDFEIYKTNTANKNSRLPDAKSSKKKENDDFLAGFMGGI